MSFLRRFLRGSSSDYKKEPMLLLYPKDISWGIRDVEKLEMDGVFKEALDRWQVLLTVFQEPDLPLEYVMLPFHRHIQFHIGLCYRNLDRYQEALDAFARAEALAQQANDQHMLAEVAGSVGIVHRKRGNLTAALQQYKSALDKATFLKETDLIATVLNNISICYFDQGDQGRSFVEAMKAYTILRNYSSQVTALVQSRILGNLGTLYALRGDIREGRQLLENGLEKAREAGSRVQEEVILETLGHI